MHDIYIAFSSFTLRFADTCTHSVPIFLYQHRKIHNLKRYKQNSAVSVSVDSNLGELGEHYSGGMETCSEDLLIDHCVVK